MCLLTNAISSAILNFRRFSVNSNNILEGDLMPKKAVGVRKLSRAYVLLALTNIGEMKRRVVDVVDSLVLILDPLKKSFLDKGPPYVGRASETIDITCHGYRDREHRHWQIKFSYETRRILEVSCVGPHLYSVFSWSVKNGVVFHKEVETARFVHDALPGLISGLVQKFPELAENKELITASKVRF